VRRLLGSSPASRSASKGKFDVACDLVGEEVGYHSYLWIFAKPPFSQRRREGGRTKLWQLYGREAEDEICPLRRYIRRRMILFQARSGEAPIIV
jgi:hypothetical protein